MFCRLTAALTLAAACSSVFATIRDDAPPRLDAFTGVMSRQELMPGDPRALARPSTLRAAMLLSENTQKHLAWCQVQTGGPGAGDRFFAKLFGGTQAVSDADRAYMLAYDPKFVTDGVTRPLAQRFATLQLVGSFQEFRQSDYDILLLIDVSFVNTFNDGFIIGSKYETGTFINVYFIDKNNRIVGKVETGELKTSERDVYLQRVAQLRQATLNNYEEALNSLLGPLPSLAPPPSPAATPAATPVRSLQERLRAVDELLKQGLLTPDEAAKKREEILKTL